MPPFVAYVLAEERALVRVCGVSLLDRMLRQLQRLTCSSATVLSSCIEHVGTDWARRELPVILRRREAGPLRARELHLLNLAEALVLSADYYCDSRLLAALTKATESALIVDSAPPSEWLSLLRSAARNQHGWVCPCARVTASSLGKVDPETEVFAVATRFVDVATLPCYVTNMRREIRPLWFPAPATAEQVRLAERRILDAAQNGTLDLPAMVHAPTETWIIARLCKTSITPNQITFLTAAVSLLVTVLFATAHLWSGTILALIVGVLDGLDGKQARVKVETTKLGKREHIVDYVLELSWWTALACRFGAYGPLVLLVVSDLFDRFAKRVAKERTGRNLDDVAPFDRFVRLIGGRRNIYVWIFAGSLLAGIPDQGFFAVCVWGALTAAVHVLRALWIARW